MQPRRPAAPAACSAGAESYPLRPTLAVAPRGGGSTRAPAPRRSATRAAWPPSAASRRGEHRARAPVERAFADAPASTRSFAAAAAPAAAAAISIVCPAGG